MGHSRHGVICPLVTWDTPLFSELWAFPWWSFCSSGHRCACPGPCGRASGLVLGVRACEGSGLGGGPSGSVGSCHSSRDALQGPSSSHPTSSPPSGTPKFPCSVGQERGIKTPGAPCPGAPETPGRPALTLLLPSGCGRVHTKTLAGKVERGQLHLLLWLQERKQFPARYLLITASEAGAD